MASISISPGDKMVIREFVQYLKGQGYPDLEIDKWPDDENRDSPDIDAIANQLAIEHTSIDTVDFQRRDSALFMHAAGDLEHELKGRFPFCFSVTINYQDIARVRNPKSVKETFREWLLSNAPSIPEGTQRFRGLPGIPFEFTVSKSLQRRPGLIFSRTGPIDNSLSMRISEQLDRKARKLSPYNSKGFTTILLLESEDIALMDEAIFSDALREAFSGTLLKGVDQIWFVDTSIPTDLEFFNLTDMVLWSS